MSRLLSVSIPDELATEAEALARATGKTKSEVVRDALRRHIQHEHFANLRRYGRDQAESLGIGPEDVEDLVDELRAART
ncbi:MAG TPA: ribbon-helix-helix domain-containing protein [Solirubrobacteraceae bacterium]|jgi:metal-responsive CopG/Arc/MetJ family transcriptional regulator|nr:ribbon-helix-helix domain-containing protein [Solirubrobacteraceae bacterium]